MTEYKIKFKVNTGRLLPPYTLEGLEIYEAENGKAAIEKAKTEYREGLGEAAEDYPLQILEVTKL